MSAEWVLWAVVMVFGVPLVCALYTIGAILRIQRETMNDWTRDPVENARRIRDMHRTTQQADSATLRCTREALRVAVETSCKFREERDELRRERDRQAELIARLTACANEMSELLPTKETEQPCEH